jgi:predicted phage gp36 major capsid-like protein
MDQHAEPGDRGVEASLKATYRALLARGLEAGEAANLTAFLHGLPSSGFHWTLPEVESIVRRRIAHAADQRAAAGAVARSAADAHLDAHRVAHGATGSKHPNPHHPSRRSTIHDRRRTGGGSTHVIDPPTP